MTAVLDVPTTLLAYGPLALALVLFLGGLGVPVPGAMLLLAAGASSSRGLLNGPLTYVHAEIWGRPNDVDVEMYSEPSAMGTSSSEWITYQKVKKDGEVLFDGVLHEDSYESLVDEHGRDIPPSEVPVAPVDP